MFEREELIVKKDESVKGWMCKEIIGVVIVNEWVFKPWYRKIFHSKFWIDIICKFKFIRKWNKI